MPTNIIIEIELKNVLDWQRSMVLPAHCLVWLWSRHLATLAVLVAMVWLMKDLWQHTHDRTDHLPTYWIVWLSIIFVFFFVLPLENRHIDKSLWQCTAHQRTTTRHTVAWTIHDCTTRWVSHDQWRCWSCCSSSNRRQAARTTGCRLSHRQQRADDEARWSSAIRDRIVQMRQPFANDNKIINILIKQSTIHWHYIWIVNVSVFLRTSGRQITTSKHSHTTYWYSILSEPHCKLNIFIVNIDNYQSYHMPRCLCSIKSSLSERSATPAACGTAHQTVLVDRVASVDVSVKPAAKHYCIASTRSCVIPRSKWCCVPVCRWSFSQNIEFKLLFFFLLCFNCPFINITI